MALKPLCGVCHPGNRPVNHSTIRIEPAFLHQAITNQILMEKEKCFITGKILGKSELVSAVSIRKNLIDFIKKDFPDFSEGSYISIDTLHVYRKKYLENIIESDIGEMDKVEHEVVEAIAKHEILSENIEVAGDDKITLGQRLADRVAAFGGSWSFIVLFGVVIIIWIAGNTFLLINKGFDPYPYILLNLILSCLAALQAPVIMMSQNRKEAKDRARSEYDYKVNLKAELEIRLLHEKIDHLMIYQTQKIMELQQLQMDYLDELSSPGKKRPMH